MASPPAKPGKRAPSLQPAPEWRETYVWIGRRLCWARELVYPSQAEFARALGVTRSTINKIENGERSLSTINLIVAGNKLRTGADYLLTGELTNVDRTLRQLLVHQHPELLAMQRPFEKSARPTFEPNWAGLERQLMTEIERQLRDNPRPGESPAPSPSSAPQPPADTGSAGRPRHRYRKRQGAGNDQPPS